MQKEKANFGDGLKKLYKTLNAAGFVKIDEM